MIPDFFEILIYFLSGGTVFFILFLFGYLGYSIVKRGKRKRIREQQKYERLEAAQMEWYLQNMDNDLKKEIDKAVKEHNKKNNIDDNHRIIYDNNFSNDLTGKIKDMIGKKFEYWINKGEDKYRILNEKHHFDDNYEKLGNIKELIQIIINKFINRWEEKEYRNKK